jgi:hypothetical protein
MTMTHNVIEIKMVDTYYTRWPCAVCGGWTEKYAVVARGEDEQGRTIDVCETCLAAGDIDDRLRQHVATMRADADLVETLIGRLKVPTIAEWRAAGDEAEAAMEAQRSAA